MDQKNIDCHVIFSPKNYPILTNKIGLMKFIHRIFINIHQHLRMTLCNDEVTMYDRGK